MVSRFNTKGGYILKKSLFVLAVLLLWGCKTASEEIQQFQATYGDCHPSAEAEEVFMKEFSALNEQAKTGLQGDYHKNSGKCPAPP